MVTQRNSFVLGKQVYHSDSHIPSIKVLAAAALILLGAGVIFALPEDSDDESPIASASANAPGSTASADDSLCDKQAWPYIDQRCAQRVEQTRSTRQVRIVTDKGNSVMVMTPVPVVEAKPKPAPRPPVVAQADRPIGPTAAPAVSEPAPQTEQVAATIKPAAPETPTPQAAPASALPHAAPAPALQTAMAPADPPPVTDAMARTPSATPPAPMAQGVNAWAEARAKKAQAAKTVAKREAKEATRRKPTGEGVPEDVVAAARSAPANGRSARPAVPAEVIAAVEQATAREYGNRRNQLVTFEPGW
jgi:hypothetical protein